MSASSSDDTCYHHYALTFNPSEVAQRFTDVRFVLVAGCVHRAEAQARYLAEQLKFNTFSDEGEAKLELLTGPRSRFALFKLGPVLVSNHGMGPASMSIALHELLLMCQRSQVIDKITLIRFGTCGGIGVEPGTLCITKRALDSLFQDFVELKICAKLVRRQCVIDMRTAEYLEHLAKTKLIKETETNLGEPFEICLGATVSTNDFYEEQGRTNGAICEHTQEDKRNFLIKAQELGVINMEMESNYMAAMCHKLGVSFAVVCVALTNRLQDDKVKVSQEQVSIFERRLFALNTLFIRYKMREPCCERE